MLEGLAKVTDHHLIIRVNTHESLITVNVNPAMILGAEVSRPGLACSRYSKEPEHLVLSSVFYHNIIL
jgi:hypothetical protein